MTSAYPGWLGALAAGVMMIYLGLQLKMLSLPEVKVRCGACGRLVWRHRTCRCTKSP